jgi:hypothetical protein
VCSYDGQQQQLAYGESHCGSASEDVIKGEDMKKNKKQQKRLRMGNLQTSIMVV